MFSNSPVFDTCLFSLSAVNEEVTILVLLLLNLLVPIELLMVAKEGFNTLVELRLTECTALEQDSAEFIPEERKQKKMREIF